MGRRTNHPPPEGLGRFALRVAVTDRCNLRCGYCMPEEGGAWTPLRKLPSLENLATLVRWIHGIYPLSKVRITGGEPTLRRGLPELVEDLREIPGSPEITLTTNGTRLEGLADELAASGLSRVNISLDTLDSDRYCELTRGGRVEDAVEGVLAAARAGLKPIRINSVLRSPSWRADVPELLDFALKHGLELRFLELMRTGTEVDFFDREAVPASHVQKWLERKGGLQLDEGEHGTPARASRLVWRGSLMPVGWITPLSDPFCSSCTRLRLDAQGRLRRCLMDSRTLPLAELLRGGDENLMRLAVRRYMGGKETPETMHNPLPMIGIGG